MTKQDILDYFSLIDFAYNESGRLESLSRMLDELLKEQEHKDKIFHALEDDWKRLKELLKEQDTVEHAKEVLCKNGWEKLRYPDGTIGKWDDPEIVRCKDCEHCYFASNRIPSEQNYACGKHGFDVAPDWFCADGERKVEE